MEREFPEEAIYTNRRSVTENYVLYYNNYVVPNFRKKLEEYSLDKILKLNRPLNWTSLF